MNGETPKDQFSLGMSIRHKIMLYVLLAVFVAVGISTYFAVTNQSQVLKRSLIQTGQNLAKHIAASTKSAFWSLNWIFVEQLLTDSAKSNIEGIIFSKIVKPNGEVYLASDRKYYGNTIDPSLLLKKMTIIEDYHFSKEEEHGILLIHPVLIGKEHWYILLGLSVQQIKKVSEALILENVKWGGLILFLAVVISYFLSRSISNPIIGLSRATKKIADGDRSHSVTITSKDEVGLLSHSFNKMTESIQMTERALKESNERFLAVLDSIDATIYVADLQTYEILFMNKYMKDVFGDNLENHICYRVFRGEDKPCAHCTNEKLVDGKGNPGDLFVWEGKNPITNRWYINYDRAIKWIDNRLVRIQIATDITKIKELEQERLETEAKLRKSQKMEAIGTLAGGVAHDLNNILSGIVSYPELLLLQLPESSPFKEPLLTIQNSGKRAATIVQDLLTLARRGVAVTEVVDLNDLILNYLESPEHQKLRSFHSNADIRTDLDSDLLPIEGSPVHLLKTIMNLVSNSAEAMPEGGKITIMTRNIYVDKPIKGYDDVKEGDYVFLSVSDTGIGISPDDMEKIFEPFYTKKVMGRSGTGLGMAVVWGTVKDHDGYIDVQSNEGQGSTFNLYFPVTRQELVEEQSTVALSNFQGNGESILIVDDVREQRDIASKILAHLDYTVHAVSSGEEATEYMKHNEADLIILDMIMDPGMDGLDTYKEILKIHPKQKAIIASGYSETARVKEAQRHGAGRYVKKPYTLEKIGLAVRMELDR